MSLSMIQKRETRKELKANYELSGLTVQQIAGELGTSAGYIKELLALRPKRLEDTWILRNYLLKSAEKQGKEPVEFTALKGDWHDYWFLNGSYIDRGKIAD